MAGQKTTLYKSQFLIKEFFFITHQVTTWFDKCNQQGMESVKVIYTPLATLAFAAPLRKKFTMLVI